jgi:lipopolysaccharide biosynthesis glycosyltransferase
MKSVVLTSFDENYFSYARVMVKSFSDNYKKEKSQDFYCLVPETLLDKEQQFKSELGDVGNLNIKFVCSPDYTQFIKDSEKINVVNEGAHAFNRHAFHRVFLSQVCDKFDKAIYFDPDTLILRDVDPILDYPLNNALMACVEVHEPTNNLTGKKDQLYFNSGVFITDLNFWRENNMHDKIKAHLYKGEIAEYMDQDILNLFFIDNLYPLPLSFNSYPMYLGDSILSKHLPDPLVIHFAGGGKPWQVVSDDKYHLIWHNLYNRLKAFISVS